MEIIHRNIHGNDDITSGSRTGKLLHTNRQVQYVVCKLMLLRYWEHCYFLETSGNLSFNCNNICLMILLHTFSKYRYSSHIESRVQSYASVSAAVDSFINSCKLRYCALAIELHVCWLLLVLLSVMEIFFPNYLIELHSFILGIFLYTLETSPVVNCWHKCPNSWFVSVTFR